MSAWNGSDWYVFVVCSIAVVSGLATGEREGFAVAALFGLLLVGLLVLGPF